MPAIKTTTSELWRERSAVADRTVKDWVKTVEMGSSGNKDKSTRIMCKDEDGDDDDKDLSFLFGAVRQGDVLG